MEKSKLLSLIKTFDKKERRAFRDFVASPFFNKNEDLVKLYDYLKSLAPHYPSAKLAREKVFRAIYPGKTYEDKQMKYLMSFLLKLAEQFIGWKAYNEQGLMPVYHQMSAFLDRGLTKHFQYIFPKAEKMVNQLPYRDADYYFQEYLLHEQSLKHQYNQSVWKFSKGLQDMADTLDIYYLSKKLKYTCAMLNMQKFLSADYQQNLTNEITHYLEQKKHEDIPAISIYYQILLTLTDESEEAHFQKLKALIQEHAQFFPASETKELYVHAINYCLRKIRQKQESYVEEALFLYNEGIAQGFLLDAGQLSPHTYKNVLKLGLRIRRYDSTENFIKNYQQALSPEVRENAVNYGLAELHYHKKDLDSAMVRLREVNFTDIFFALDAKVMLAKIYFQKEDWEPLHSLLAAFKVYLRRNKLISNTVKETYMNFLNLLNSLVFSNRASYDELSKSVGDVKLLTERKWLKEAIESRRIAKI